LSRHVRIRLAVKRDVSAIEKSISKWLNWEIPREESIKRAIRKKELLVADQQENVIGFIHQVMHEDIIDSGLNSFITCFYVVPEFRGRGVGSRLLRRAIKDALGKAAVGVEVSTASRDARRFYERHHFKQFMGNGTMGEVFLELDTEVYERALLARRKKPRKISR
jgi:ribosomal protein S18 acetylase RimI-like enzyme